MKMPDTFTGLLGLHEKLLEKYYVSLSISAIREDTITLWMWQSVMLCFRFTAVEANAPNAIRARKENAMRGRWMCRMWVCTKCHLSCGIFFCFQQRVGLGLCGS